MVAVQHKLTTETPDQSALMETRMLAVPSSAFHFIPDAEYVQNGELNFALLPPRDESGREAHARLEEAASLLREGNVVAVPTESTLCC